MLYDIGLTITQEYEVAAVGSRQALRLMPPTLPGEQQLIAGSLSVSPEPQDRRDYRDFFGNGVVEVGYTGAHDEIEFRVSARVRREPSPVAAALPLSPDLAGLAAEIARERSLAPESPHHFRWPTPRVPAVPEMGQYAREIVTAHTPALQIVETLGLALNRDMTFDAKATTVDTPVAEAFAARHGVCQDFSHIMIGCLRSLGVPAAYVSGFLRTIPPEGQPRLQGADAMHAWVRAWCGADTGWVEYDPTNAVFAGVDHIVVAVGRDYGDVAPVKGVLRTYGVQSASHAVDVIEVE